MQRVLSVKNLFSLFLIAWFAYGVWEARSYAFLAKIFPLYVSLVLLVVAVISIVLEVRRTADRAGNLQDASGASDLAVKWDIPMSMVWQRFGFYLATILGLYLLIYLVGYPLAITLFILLFYRLVAGAGWVTAVVAALAGFGFLALASSVMGMDWPQGLIRLPWPLG